MTNSQEICSIALGLEEPWQISSVSFDKDKSQLNIHLSFTKGYKFETEDDDHDTVERSWQHLNFFQHH